MGTSFQVFLTKPLTSTCIFIFHNLSSHYVVGMFYPAPVRKIEKTCNSWLLPILQSNYLHQLLISKKYNSWLHHIHEHWHSSVCWHSSLCWHGSIRWHISIRWHSSIRSPSVITVFFWWPDCRVRKIIRVLSGIWTYSDRYMYTAMRSNTFSVRIPKRARFAANKFNKFEELEHTTPNPPASPPFPASYAPAFVTAPLFRLRPAFVCNCPPPLNFPY